MKGEIVIAVIGAAAVTIAWLCVRMVQEESRRWRRLMQLYFEKQVQAPLPIDEDPEAPAESALHLPDDEREELERQAEEEAEVAQERLQ